MSLKTLKRVFWLGLVVTIAIIPLIVYPITYDALICLPLGAGLVLARKIATLFGLSGRVAEMLVEVLIILSGIAQVVLLVSISLVTRYRLFYIILAVLVVLLLMDVEGCRQTITELKQIT